MKHEVNETVAMDLKEWTKGTGFYIVDHITRYSARTVIKIKKKQLIVEEIFKIWIKAFGFLKNVKQLQNIKSHSAIVWLNQRRLWVQNIQHRVPMVLVKTSYFMGEILDIYHFSMANNF